MAKNALTAVQELSIFALFMVGLADFVAKWRRRRYVKSSKAKTKDA
jgi:hypothetical protein